MSGERITATVKIWEQILPAARGERYQAPLEELLDGIAGGEVTGAGTQLTPDEEIDYVDIGLVIHDDSDLIHGIIELLNSCGAPKHSQLSLTRNGLETHIPFGLAEGVAVTLPNIPSEADVKLLVTHIVAALGDGVDFRGAYLVRESELSMYFYGLDAEAMWTTIESVIDSAPPCRGARAVIRCGHVDGRPREVTLTSSDAADNSDFYLRRGAWSSQQLVSDTDANAADEDRPIVVEVLVAEDDSYAPWTELQADIEAQLLIAQPSLNELNVLLGDVEASTASAKYLSNTRWLSLTIPSTSEDTAAVIEEIGLALTACEQHPVAIEQGIGKFVNPEWSPEQSTASAQIEMTVREADLADVLRPDVIHANARSLMTDEWFWDDDDLAPFGSDDATEVLKDIAILNRKGELYDAAALDLSLGEALGEDLSGEYWRRKEVPLAEPDDDDWEEAICIDEMTIASAFAQLAIRGTIDREIRLRARLSLERQLRLDVPDAWLPRVSKMLEILAEVESSSPAPAG
jgi:uncharacterized protein YfeS